MANYWANLDSATNPGSVGSAIDPFGLAEYIAAASAGGGDVFNIRGSNSLMANFMETGHTHQAWDIALYGPWRLQSGFFLVSFAAATVSDAVLDVLGLIGVGMQPTRVYAVSTLWIKTIGDATNCTLISGAANDIAEMMVATWNRNVFILTGREVSCGSNTLFTNNATDAANFAAMTATAGGVPTDGGGQVYGIVPAAAPAWNTPTLTDFDLYPGYGVGTLGCWAYTTPVVPPTPPSGSGKALYARKLYEVG